VPHPLYICSTHKLASELQSSLLLASMQPRRAGPRWVTRGRDRGTVRARAVPVPSCTPEMMACDTHVQLVRPCPLLTAQEGFLYLGHMGCCMADTTWNLQKHTHSHGCC
jgi:hypothetical protein